MKKIRSKRWWYGFYGISTFLFVMFVRAFDDNQVEIGDNDPFPLNLILIAVSLAGVAIPYFTLFSPAKVRQTLRERRDGEPMTLPRAEDFLSRLGGALSFSCILYGSLVVIYSSEPSAFWPFAGLGAVAATAYWFRIDRALEQWDGQS